MPSSLREVSLQGLPGPGWAGMQGSKMLQFLKDDVNRHTHVNGGKPGDHDPIQRMHTAKEC